MYREIAQWRQIRRRVLVDGTPKKQVARETGISRRTLNRISRMRVRRAMAPDLPITRN